jgi:beta-glucosidase
MDGKWSAHDVDVEQLVESLLGQLSLKEKVALLSGKDTWQTVPIKRLGIPSLVMTDGPHGVRANRTGEERIQGAATSFPTGVSLASSWNTELVHSVGVALAEETRAMGCDILLAPCINIVRTPLAGRNFESYAEDPYLAGRIAVAYVVGVQSRNVGTSVKHYACNNQEIERFRGSSEVDERTLREIYLPAFEATIVEAQPWTVMCSYNRINGVYASQNDYLLNVILRDEWGFEGVVISDWGANHTTVESVQGGLDIEMPGPAKWYGPLLAEAVRNWQIEERTIDNAVRRILRMLVRSAKLDDPSALPPGSVNTPEHQALARELAEESIVLLKNEQDVLPLKADQIKSIAVIGPNAAEARIGGGGSSYLEPPYRVSPLEGLKAAVGDGVEIVYEPGCDEPFAPASEPDDRMVRAVELARRSDVALVFAGMPQGFETEGTDRPHMRLPGPQDELIRAVAQANANTVVVLNCGSPVEMPWIDEVAAVLLAFYPGQEGGNAIANILLGIVTPSGKLSVTYPRRYEDNPTSINYPGTREVRYGEGIYVGYRYYDAKGIEPLFPFGYGLSYTRFHYDSLRVPERAVIGAPVEVSVTVTNSGQRAGKEIVQLYVHDEASSLDRPVKELKGFAKVSLEPGERTVVRLTLDQRAFSFYDPHRANWVTEPGAFEILVGASSRDIRATGTVVLE